MSTLPMPASPLHPLRLRLGLFSLGIDLVEHDPEAARAALEGCVVVRAECMWHRREIEYVAMHAEFDNIAEQYSASPYRCELYRHADGSVTRAWVKGP